MVRIAALWLVLVVLVALPAEAQSPPGAVSPETEYLSALGRGLAASRSGDRPGAMAAFGEAARVLPARPEAFCLLAETHRLVGDLEAAIESFRGCLRVAREAGDARWIGRALHGIASTLERRPERIEEARSAWREYVLFADGAASVALPSLGRARITAIDQVIELERVSAEVRQRIVQRERERAEQASRPAPASGGPRR
jgi:tetratricopeptide (TPR) repeat protein